MSDRVVRRAPGSAEVPLAGQPAAMPAPATGVAPEPLPAAHTRSAAIAAGGASHVTPVTLCGSIARLAGPVGRALHEAGYRALGLPFTYVPFEVEPSRLEEAVRGMRALGIRGLGVSQPFKERVIDLLDELEPVARRIGAVNTIVNESGTLVGHNTDWLGAVRAIEEVRPLAGARVLLAGAGGAARAIAFGLRERGARASIANRDGARAERLAAQTGARPVPWDALAGAASYDVVINATSVGQHVPANLDVGQHMPANPDVGQHMPANLDVPRQVPAGDGGPVASVFPESALGPGLVVFDIVYKPFETPLVLAARRRGARVIHGGRMLVFQAAAQFELYTGLPAPLSAMERALESALSP